MQRTMHVMYSGQTESVIRPVGAVEKQDGRWVPVPKLKPTEIYERLVSGQVVVIDRGDSA